MEVQTSSKPSPPEQITPAQDMRARWFLGSGYSPERTSEILKVPLWYCQDIKAGGFFARWVT